MSFASQASKTPAIIIYPEDTRYLSNITPEEKKAVANYFSTTLFIDGDTVIIGNGFSNISFFYYPKEQLSLARGKELLLPFNEYIPYVFSGVLTLVIGKYAMQEYRDNHTYTPLFGKKTVTFGNLTLGTIICSEITSFSTLTAIKKEKPAVVFFQSQLSVFRNNPLFSMHLRSFTKVAAAQLRTTVVSSSNAAPSFIVSPHGFVLRVIPASFSTTTYTLTP